MCPQIACMRRGIVALITFVWLFSTVCFQMCSQIACPRRGKVTLVAFFYFSPLCIFKWPAREDAKSHWLHLFFSTVRVQMRPQNVYTRSCIITLIAFVWLISTVCSQMSPHMWGCTGCNYLTSLFCAFSNVSSNCLPENRHINLAFSSLCF